MIAPAPIALAPRDTWPAYLRDPPWRDPARLAPVRHIVSVSPLATSLSFDAEAEKGAHGLSWPEARALVLPFLSSLAGVIAMTEAALAPTSERPRVGPAPETLVPLEAGDAAVLSWFVTRLDQLDATKARPWSATPYEAIFEGLGRQPAELALRLWRRGGPLLALVRWREGPARAMVRRFGRQVLPELVGLVAENPLVGFERFADLGAGEFAPVTAQVLARHRVAREAALAWLRRHRAVA
ncbi:hypothetical protein D3272_11355 [Lichenibacterium ramalinae]|uniref:Uncharacterized protein n=1 Tax=Lichenibacterium ramalinae TaxID=2316527 RepID=A0A4Q2RCY4_9HYPH|nr:hypothetical protein D3272_11355 [Lichenibacterium ramalinae]